MVSVASLCIAGFTRAAGEEHFLYYVREPSGRSFLHTTSMRAAGEEKKYTTSAGLPEFLFFTTSASLPVVPFFEYYFMDKPYAF